MTAMSKQEYEAMPVEFKLNGKDVVGYGHETIIQTAQRLGVEIPRLCYKEGMRGQYDGIAAMDDLLEFFKLLPNADKQFAVMPGIAHNSTKAVNYAIAYHILLAFLTQPAPLYRG